MDEAALQQLIDRIAIMDVKHRYCRMADVGNTKGMAAIFTDPCRVNFRPDRTMERRTPAEVLEYFESAMATVVASSHHVSNFEIQFTDQNTARSTCALYSWQRYTGYPDEPDRHRWVRYQDTFVRTSDGWRQSELLYLVAGEYTGGETRGGELAARPWSIGGL